MSISAVSFAIQVDHGPVHAPDLFSPYPPQLFGAQGVEQYGPALGPERFRKRMGEVRFRVAVTDRFRQKAFHGVAKKQFRSLLFPVLFLRYGTREFNDPSIVQGRSLLHRQPRREPVAHFIPV